MEQLNKQIANRMEHMTRMLKKTRLDTAKKDPFVVTIARSSNDGFTPNNLVETLQAQVLQSVHNVFCECHHDDDDETMVSQTLGSAIAHFNSNSSQNGICRLRILFDYGEWEGSSFTDY